MDGARKLTDKKLASIERRLTLIYTQAEAEISAEWNEYMKQLNKRLGDKYNKLQQAIASGDSAAVKAARDEYRSAVQWGTFMNKKYARMVDNTTDNFVNVNKIAVAYLNGEVPSIYADNYNGISNNIKQVVKAYDFTAVDAETVRQLTMLNNTLMLPQQAVNVAKDKLWNTKQINNAVLQGILQGDSIPKIASRLEGVTDSNRKAAIRNARTMVTAAENRGRLAGMERAEQSGIILQKEWIATPDSRTRDSHLALDGERIDINQKFSNGLLYPGDYAGRPSEVYNCRCSMRTRVIGFRKSDGHIDYVQNTGGGNSLHNRQMEIEREKRR